MASIYDLKLKKVYYESLRKIKKDKIFKLRNYSQAQVVTHSLHPLSNAVIAQKNK